MKQEFVYHALKPRKSVRQPARAQAADASLAVKEYLAYLATLSIAVAIAIITFAYAANITIKWLDAVTKPAFLSQSQVAPAQPSTLAMLPAAKPFRKAD